jgi:hypothetical protein
MKALDAARSAAIACALLLGAARPASADDMGFLDISSDPPDAKILIDDGDVGQTTPQHHLPVHAGHHRLTLVTKDGAHKRSVGITVDAGQTKKLTLVFAK